MTWVRAIARLHEFASGYFLFDADSAEHAAEIARTCPHSSYGGDVTLGRIAR